MANLYSGNIVMNGYHAYLLKKYSRSSSALNKVEFIVKDVDNNDKEIELFDNLMYCFNIAAMVGFIKNKKVDEMKYLDIDGKNYSATIFYDKVYKSHYQISKIYQYIILCGETTQSVDLRIKNAFSLDQNIEYRKEIESYVRGGLEIINSYFENCKTYEEVLQQMALFVNDFNISQE